MRNPVACVACRAAKRQCIHNDRPPCKRCKDRAEECYFPPPGTSSLHRRGRVRQALEIPTQRHRRPQEQGRLQVADLQSRTSPLRTSGLLQSGDVSEASSSTAIESVDLSHLDPFVLFTDEVKNSYLRCSYKWSFHHIPTLLLEVRRETLDIGMLWAILALAIRFTTSAPAPFPTPISASNGFAAHARNLLLPSISSPSLSKIQGLLMITGHSWGAGEARQAWIYLGVAVRMAQVAGLFEELEDEVQNDAEDFIKAEEKRRTAWTCFLMDSLLSGGTHRRRSLSATDMKIPLPCDFDAFHFGEPVKVPRISPVMSSSVSESLGIVAQSMLAADTWGAVAHWACSSAVEEEKPWESSSQFQNLLSRLNIWKRGLPRRLEFGMESLRAHSAANQGQAWCYMHSIYFMSIMFLHRAYLSPSPKPDRDFQDQLWKDWTVKSRQELFRITENVCTMYEEMRDFGLFFLRGLVPWIGFTVYTAVGIMLYFYHFPDSPENESDEETIEEITRRVREHVVAGCAFLKDMRGSWPMADSWRETIKRMQIFYANIKTRGESAVSPMERNQMRDAIVDYGALHHTPVSDQTAPSPVVATPGSGSQGRRESFLHNQHQSPEHSGLQSITQGAIVAHSQVQRQDQTNQFGLNHHEQANSPLEQPSQLQPQHLTFEDLSFPDIDITNQIFDTDFSFSSIPAADLEALIYNATQDFWINFPGETEMY